MSISILKDVTFNNPKGEPDMKTIKLTEFKPSRKAMKYVAFARFCVDQGLEAHDVAELVTLAERAFSAGERYCNSGSNRDSTAEQRACDRFKIKARSLGFGVAWHGLWPTLRKAGADGVMRDIELPTFKD